MKKIMSIGLLIVALLLVPRVFAQSTPPLIESPNKDLMVIVYNINDLEVAGWTRYTEDLEITGDSLYSSDLILEGIDWGILAYGIYQHIEIESRYDENGALIPWLLSELAPQPIEAADLPHSQHIAKIKSICLSCAKPLTVTRKWMGELYDIDCLVSQSIVELYQMGKIEAGDYVIVSFIDENPDSQEINIPVAVDKVYQSWN